MARTSPKAAATEPAPAPQLVRVRVRIDAARVPHGIVAPQRRVRAGFVFSVSPREIVVSEDTLRLIECDPMLHVERLA